MAQKPLFKKAQKAKSKSAAANRHGKDLKVRKGGSHNLKLSTCRARSEASLTGGCVGRQALQATQGRDRQGCLQGCQGEACA